MALKLADRVQETTTTSGTGTLSLAGATSGFQSFVNGIGSGNTCYYTIYDPVAPAWEVGIGTVTSGTPNTLSRTTVLSSSNSGSLVNLAGNSAYVWCDYPSEKAVYEDTSGNVTVPNSLTGGNVYASNGVLSNAQVVTANVTVPSGYNVISVGPWSVASGVTFTLPSGSRQVIV